MLKRIFLISFSSVVLTVLMVLFVLPTPDQSTIENRTADGALLILNATIFDGERFQESMDIEVRDGVISKLSPHLSSSDIKALDLESPNLDLHSSESDLVVQIDASGKTIIPGLIDAHTHSYGNSLAQALNFGVTTHVDMFTPPNALKNERSIRNDDKQYKQADLFSAGLLATVDGGHGTQFGIPIDTVSSPADATQWVKKRIAEGSDFIKLVYMPYSKQFKSLDRQTAAAIIVAAHEQGLMVVAHISTQRAALELLEDGIDGFVHIFADEKVSPRFVQLSKANNIFVVPTLSVIASASNEKLGAALADDKDIADYLVEGQAQQLRSGFGDREIPGFELATAIHNTKVLHESGVTILAGSDAPNPGTSYGASLHQELELLTQAGLSVGQAINAASKDVADTFKLKTPTSMARGHLVVGAKADFIVLDSLLTMDIKATRKIGRVFKNGVEVKRVRSTSSNSGKIASPLLSDFTQGVSSPSKLFWSETDDSVASGLSTASFTIEDSMLKVNAKVSAGFMSPWAGAVAYGKRQTDVSDYSAIRFKVRGTAGDYRAMTFSGANSGRPPSQTFAINGEWQTIELALSDFVGLDSTQFSGVAIVAGPGVGEFEYFLDDVKLIK